LASPPLAAAAPVSEVYEKQFFDFHGYPYYWAGEAPWGPGHYARSLFGVSREDAKKRNLQEQAEKKC